MRLLMVSGDRQVTVGERGPFHAMLRSFSKHFERIDVIVPKPAAVPSVLTVFDRVFFHVCPGARWRMPDFILKTGSEIIREHSPALIVSHDYGWFYNGIGSAYLSNRTGVPYLSELHHIPGHPKPADLRERFDKRVAKLYVGWARKQAKAFRVVNRVEMPALLQSWGVPEHQVVVLPSLYIDFKIFHPPEHVSPFDQDVVFVGRLVNNKGLDRIVAALKRLKEEGRPARALFIGKGPLRAWLHRAVRDAGLSETARFIEWLDTPEELAEAYRRSRIALCASTCEGGPRVTVEAMACGTPAISTRVGVMSELLEDGSAGRLVDFDVDSLKEAIGELLANEERRRAMGQAAVQLAAQYEYESVLETYARGLHDLVGLEMGA